ERGLVEIGHAAGEELRAVADVGRLLIGRARARAAAERELHLQLRVLAAQALHFGLQLLDGFGRLVGRHAAEHRRRAVEGLEALLYPGDGRRAGQRLDAPDARRDARLLGEHERADVAGRPYVRAAAELQAVAVDRDDAHTVAVFLAEQRHRALPDGFLGRLLLGDDREVAQDLLVDLALDLAPFLGRERLEVIEVEAQPVGRDERALLPHVRAEARAQRGVQQVRRRVIAPRGVAQRGVDDGVDAVAGAKGRGRPHAVDACPAGRHARHGGDGRDYVALTTEDARVGHLAARLDVERRPVENHVALGAGRQFGDERARVVED